MIILSIDTSCDDTSAAVTDDAHVLSNVISSQVRYHKKYGGVVPFLAQRLHRERIRSVIQLALSRSRVSWNEIEAVAVTYGPGLAPALEVGIATTKELARERQLPVYAVNHMAGHIASCFAVLGTRPRDIRLPALALLVSGGHTELVLVKDEFRLEVLGETLDDALGEAYDKLAKMLNLGYPGGPVVATLAERGNSTLYNLPVPMQKSGDLNFSYSGLKNAVRLLINNLKELSGTPILNQQQIQDICAGFERVAHQSVVEKVEMAARLHPEIKSLLMAGGVAANTALRARLRRVSRQYGLAFYTPSNQKLCTDNAAMIGVAAYLGRVAGQSPVALETLDRMPGLHL
ncbi:tRNA (adenosine(37)-N6)-threonylcarbamoyltransferase complex transferase subunit TsaD [Patescibacteria group bacterium]|nr:tRNA (adenosine(37)-N6)-threonylcarbamoyltransferase complex transferase subunit TsaD [Patescibacteria group bacterium]